MKVKAEGEGFEPSSDLTARNGFRDRRIRPLCHPSAEPCGQTAGYPLPLADAMRQRTPPEPGLARREASDETQKRNEEEGAVRGKHSFPRKSELARRSRAASDGEGGIRTLEAGMYPT
jgi:hypothetical protein